MEDKVWSYLKQQGQERKRERERKKQERKNLHYSKYLRLILIHVSKKFQDKISDRTLINTWNFENCRQVCQTNVSDTLSKQVYSGH